MADDGDSHLAQASNVTASVNNEEIQETRFNIDGNSKKKNKKNGYDSDTDLESLEDELLRKLDIGNSDHQQTAMKIFALDQLSKPTSPKVTKMRRDRTKQLIPGLKFANSNAITADLRRTGATVGSTGEVLGVDSGREEDGELDGDGEPRRKLRPRTPLRPDQNSSRMNRTNRSESMAWAETASRMRRSVRMSRLVDGSLVIPEKDENSPEKKEQALNAFVNNKLALKSRMEGVAARLTGTNLMNAKHMGNKGYWSLAQVITATNLVSAATAGATSASSTSVSKPSSAVENTVAPLELSKFFMLYASVEVSRMIAEMHANTKAHGHLSADSVLFNRNLNVALQKPKILRVKEQFNIKKFHNDILHIGIILIEIFTLKRVGAEFCPSLFKAQELEFTLGEGKMMKFSSRSNRYLMKNRARNKNAKKKGPSFEELEGQIQEEVAAALKDVKELEGMEGVKKLLFKCLNPKGGARPVAVHCEQTLQLELDNLIGVEKIDEQEELLKILRDFIQHNKLLMRHLKGPPVVDVTEKGITEDGERVGSVVETGAMKKAFPGKLVALQQGDLTDDSFYVEEGGSDAESVISEIDDRDFEELENQRQIKEMKHRLRSKGVNNKKKRDKPKGKSAFNKFKAFISAHTEVNREELDDDETQSNLELVTKGKQKGPGLKARIRKQKKASRSSKAAKSKKSLVAPPEAVTVKEEAVGTTKDDIAGALGVNKQPEKKQTSRKLSAFLAFTEQVVKEALDDEEEEEEEDEDGLDIASDPGQQQEQIQAKVKENYAILPENLKVFKDEFAAKKQARKLKKRFKPEDIAANFDLQKRLPVDVSEAILERAYRLLSEEPNLLDLTGPVTVVGDIHGQYFDLRNMLKMSGKPGKTIRKVNGVNEKQSYLFLGDYVDRGNFSCEVLFYLLTLKLKYPAHVWLLRGNHESKATAGFFGFKDECESKYGVKMFLKCCEVFQAMPIAAVVSTPGGRFFCLHGGISPNVTHLHQFTEFDRFVEPQMYGFLCDVLWADPVTIDDEDNSPPTNFEEEDEDEDEGGDGEGDEDGDGEGDTELENKILKTMGEYYANPLRGCSFRFGLTALRRFLDTNNLVAVVRAHQVQSEGYYFHYQDLTFDNFDELNKANKVQAFQLSSGNNTLGAEGSKPKAPEDICPPIITVFSAPNYCGKYGNRGAYLNLYRTPPEQIEDYDIKSTSFPPLTLLDPIQFEAVEEPPVVELPNVKEKQNLDLEVTCPYMPTGFDAFISKALSLQNTDMIQVLSENAHEAWEEAKKNVDLMVKMGQVKLEEKEKKQKQKQKPSVPPRKGKRGKVMVSKKNSDASSVSNVSAVSGVTSMAKKKKKAVKLEVEGKEEEVSKTFRPKYMKQKSYHENDPTTWTKLQDRIKTYEKTAAKKYHEAQNKDRLNEMNPLRLTITAQKAEKRMASTNNSDFNLPASIQLNNTAEEEEKTASKQLAGRLGLAGNSISQGSLLNLGFTTSEKVKGVDINEKKKRASYNLTELQNQKTVTFERRELIALQTLFMLIDRKEKGKIDDKDLINWTEDAGGFITEGDAKTAIEIVDFDKDGFIGFEDYLVFAAACKKIWLAETYASILMEGIGHKKDE